MADSSQELLDLRVALAAEKVKSTSLAQEVARLRETVGKLVRIGRVSPGCCYGKFLVGFCV